MKLGSSNDDGIKPNDVVSSVIKEGGGVGEVITRMSVGDTLCFCCCIVGTSSRHSAIPKSLLLMVEAALVFLDDVVFIGIVVKVNAVDTTIQSVQK